MPTKLPTNTQSAKLVRLLACYVLTDGAPIKKQQRVYDTYMSYLEALEARYPGVNFRSEASQKNLVARAKTIASAKLFRGAGATY